LTNTLAAALVWRDEQLAKVAVLTMAEFCGQKCSSNTSGAPGVHFLKCEAQPLGFWQVKLKTGGGKYLSHNFSVLQYGDKEAFDFAVAARQSMLESMEDKPYVHHPTTQKFAKK
jgi:hypothetical protein